MVISQHFPEDVAEALLLASQLRAFILIPSNYANKLPTAKMSTEKKLISSTSDIPEVVAIW